MSCERGRLAESLDCSDGLDRGQYGPGGPAKRKSQKDGWTCSCRSWPHNPCGCPAAQAGGQDLNIGVHDAVNLGWTLAQVVKGISSESLLDPERLARSLRKPGSHFFRTALR